jgi:ATP-binding cassette, subfamily B, bacterial
MAQIDFNEDEYHGKLDLKMWFNFLCRAKKYRRNLIALMIVGFLAAIGDASFGLITKLVIDEAVGDGKYLWHWVGAYMGGVLLLCTSIWIFIYNAGKVSRYLSHDIRSECFEKLQTLSFSYYDTRPVGWLLSRVTSDCDRLSMILAWGLLDMMWGMCVITLMTGVMLALNWQLALIVLAFMPPLLIISKFFQKKILLASRRIRKLNSIITSSYNEEIMGVQTTKTLVRESDNLNEFKLQTDEMYAHAMRNAVLTSLYIPLVITIGAAATGFALWYGGGQVLAQAITLGTLVAFLSYAGQFFAPIREIANTVTQMQGAQSAGERVMSLLNTEPEIKDDDQVNAKIKALELAREQNDIEAIKSLTTEIVPTIIHTIEFNNVSFEYKDGTKVLNNFNLTVDAGQTIALVGATGGGKSTIVNLVCRFYEPNRGEILINGIDYRKRSLEWLQSNLGIVLQTPHLFSGSIRENIRYGQLDATDQQVEHAVKLVNAHAFITQMQDGYDTEVGEGGGRLSTGQKQLVSFARAILANPQMFVMDEATSSIDTETEQRIQDALKQMVKGRISFVIAHRLSTIRNADCILVIDDGEIVEQGNHAKLLDARGRYFELYTRYLEDASGKWNS